MDYQTIFQRYETKYLLTCEQQSQLLERMAQYMQLDQFGHTTIRNIYFDTDNWYLVRKSMERPIYKEKLRIRSYRQVKNTDTVFVELKKKYRSIVYKRRIPLSLEEAMNWFCNGGEQPVHSQVADELEYFRHFYRTLKPAVFLTYERDAYYSTVGEDLRVTFDTNILFRQNARSLSAGVGGFPVLGEDQNLVLMELKTRGGIPLWMTRFLSENEIRQTSISKYGRAYQNLITASVSNYERSYQDLITTQMKGAFLYA